MHFHWHNENEKPGGRKGSPLRHGQAWLSIGNGRISWEWVLLFTSSCRLCFEVEQSEDLGFGFSIAVPLMFSFFVNVSGFRPLVALARWLLRNAKYEDRETSVRVHDWTLWWTVWRDNGSWTSTTPRWREGNFHFLDFALGRAAYSERVLKTVQTAIPMLEANYPATVELREDTWKRPRWFARRLLRTTVQIPKGVPHPGKGENSWDCGEDATYSLSCCASTVEEAVAAVVESVLRSRRRHGGSVDWRPAARRAPEPLEAQP